MKLNSALIQVIAIACFAAIVVSARPSSVRGLKSHQTPEIYGMNPRSGPVAGGNVVTIYGRFLTNEQTGDITSVRVAETNAAVLSRTSSEVVVRVGNAGAAKSGTVRIVSTANGEIVSTKQYTYDADASVITAIVPSYGPVTGGAHVTIKGRFLTNEQTGDITSVRIADTNAAVISRTETEIVARAGNPGSAKAGTVRVLSTAYGEILSTLLYTYDPYASGVISIFPEHGPATGGAYVTIKGIFLTNEETADITSVRIADTNAAVISRTATEIVAKTGCPTGEKTGTVRIVSAAFGEILSNVQYTYDADASVITSINPSNGPVSGGNKITIHGHFLTNEETGDITSVRVAETNAFVVSRTAEKIVVRLGRASEATTGTVRVVSSAFGEILSDVEYTYKPGHRRA